MLQDGERDTRTRLRKSERLDRILLELKLRPHVRITELSERFGVSNETIRRDFEALSEEGLVSREHGGASSPPHRHYPGFDERNRARIEERERIGRFAASLVEDGDTIMVDAGSTTLQFARFLAHAGTGCTVITNSLHAAVALGQSAEANVVLCPGDFVASEAAVVGPDAIEFIQRQNVRKCFIGSSNVSEDGVSERVRDFAAIKRAFVKQSQLVNLLVDGSKFGKAGLSLVARPEEVATIVVDKRPAPEFSMPLKKAGVEILVATE